MIKNIIADIDGTIVNTKREMTTVTANCITKLHESGYRIGIASGRPIEERMLTRYQRWGLKQQFDFFIGMNGSEIYDLDSGEFLNIYPLSVETIKEIIDLMSQFECNPTCYVKDEQGSTVMLGLKMDAELIASAKRNEMPAIKAKDISDFYKVPNAKIMFRMHEEETNKAVKFLESIASDCFIGYRSQPSLLEFTDPRVNKGFALKKYCEKKCISINEVAAFGDMDNDNEMLRVAGLGVAMKNGSDVTKSYADTVTDRTNDEDGFAHYIYKYILRENINE